MPLSLAGINTSIMEIVIKSLMIFLLILITEYSHSQDFRDSLIGNYYCNIKRTDYYPPNTITSSWFYDTLVIFKDTSNSEKLWFNDPVLCHDQTIINLPCEYFEFYDSTFSFSSNFFGIESSGSFYPNNDSLMFSNIANGVYAGYGEISYTYNCKRISSISNSENQVYKEVFNIFPVPTSNVLTIVPSHEFEYEIKIIDCFNRQIYKDKVYGQMDIDMKNYKSGIYMVYINHNQVYYCYKILKI
jgi:hypothetical protein